MEVAALTSFLAPFLPYLLKAGGSAAEEAGKALGADAWMCAKALWRKLQPAVEGKPAASEAAADVVESPDDEDALAALRQQLKKILEQDEALAAEVAELWREAEAANVTTVTVTASGERAIAVGRDAIGSTFVTGDAKTERD